ncbi:MAG: phospholipase, partial [Bacteroidota bacterium]
MKHVQTSIQAPYFTLNELTPKTKRIWMACHGYGQLAKYFMRRFDVLDPEENFIIVPQGLSLFYLDSHEFKYQKVGASWITREDRETALANMQVYLNAAFEQETAGFDLSDVEISLFGFSQGTAAITRWGIINK